MRFFVQQTPLYTAGEFGRASIVVILPPAVAKLLQLELGWNRWIPLSIAVLSLVAGAVMLSRMRMQRVRLLGERLKHEAEERRASGTHA